jgi:hypothetical protein
VWRPARPQTQFTLTPLTSKRKQDTNINQLPLLAKSMSTYATLASHHSSTPLPHSCHPLLDLFVGHDHRTMDAASQDLTTVQSQVSTIQPSHLFKVWTNTGTIVYEVSTSTLALAICYIPRLNLDSGSLVRKINARSCCGCPSLSDTHMMCALEGPPALPIMRESCREFSIYAYMRGCQ